jgi:ABC-type nitrate/sulfonate/bicarbonate transport systems, periplasmic components
MAKDIIKIVGFEKDITLSIAETKGFFSARGLEITFDQTPNSTTEISGLLTGKWDVAFDNGDNLVAWDEGQGADGEVHDLFIFMGGSRELNQGLFVSPGINGISDLKGKILGVDASTTGFAVVLRYILQCNELFFLRDYANPIYRCDSSGCRLDLRVKKQEGNYRNYEYQNGTQPGASGGRLPSALGTVGRFNRPVRFQHGYPRDCTGYTGQVRYDQIAVALIG